MPWMPPRRPTRQLLLVGFAPSWVWDPQTRCRDPVLNARCQLCKGQVLTAGHWGAGLVQADGLPNPGHSALLRGAHSWTLQPNKQRPGATHARFGNAGKMEGISVNSKPTLGSPEKPPRLGAGGLSPSSRSLAGRPARRQVRGPPGARAPPGPALGPRRTAGVDGLWAGALRGLCSAGVFSPGPAPQLIPVARGRAGPAT